MEERRPYTKRLWDIASGTRTAAVLITVFAALSVAGVLYPQRRLMSAADLEALHSRAPLLSRLAESVGLDRLFSTPVFLGVVLLLALNTGACTLRRSLARRKPRVPSKLPTGGPGVRELPPGGLDLAQVARALGPRPLLDVREEAREGGTWTLVTGGRLGFYGSMLFHAALLVIAAGGVLSVLTTFSGRMVVAEGQTVVDERASYLNVTEEPRLGQAYTGRRFTLERLDYTYDGTTLTRARAAFALPDGGRSVEAGVNYPLDLAGRSYLLGDSGYAVTLTVGGSGNAETISVNLGERREAGYSDVVQVRDGLRLQLYAVPRADVPLGEEVPRRYEIREPVLHVVVQGGGASDARRQLRIGESVNAGGVTVRFDGLRLWNQLLVRQDGGKLLVYLGFWLAVAGLTARLLDPERRVLLAAEGDRVVLVARHRYGRAASDVLADRVASAARACENAPEEVSG